MDPAQKEEAIRIYSDPKVIKQVTDKAFAEIDTDRSGFIERKEFATVCKLLAKDLGVPEPSAQEIDESLKAIDQNNDGKISKKELGDLIAFLFKVMLDEIKKA